MREGRGYQLLLYSAKMIMIGKIGYGGYGGGEIDPGDERDKKILNLQHTVTSLQTQINNLRKTVDTTRTEKQMEMSKHGDDTVEVKIQNHTKPLTVKQNPLDDDNYDIYSSYL